MIININDRAIKLVGTGVFSPGKRFLSSQEYVCPSCGRDGQQGCSHCYKELVTVSSEWAKENLVLHKRIKEMEHTISELLKREFE